MLLTIIEKAKKRGFDTFQPFFDQILALCNEEPVVKERPAALVPPEKEVVGCQLLVSRTGCQRPQVDRCVNVREMYHVAVYMVLVYQYIYLICGRLCCFETRWYFPSRSGPERGVPRFLEGLSLEKRGICRTSPSRRRCRAPTRPRWSGASSRCSAAWATTSPCRAPRAASGSPTAWSRTRRKGSWTRACSSGSPTPPAVLSTGAGRHWPHGRGVFVFREGNKSAWINEEEHLKLLVERKDGNLKESLKEVDLAAR